MIMGTDEQERRDERQRRDTDRIWTALDDIRQRMTTVAVQQDEAQKLLQEVRSDVKEISLHGCAMAAQHHDHEVRLRQVEKAPPVSPAPAVPSSWTDVAKIAVSKSPMAIAVGVGLVAINKPLQMLLMALIQGGLARQ